MTTTQQATDLNTAMKVAEHLLFPSKGQKSIPIAIVGQSGIGKTAALTALAGRREHTVSTSFEALKEGRHRPDRPTLYILKGFNRENHDLQRELASLLTRRNQTPVVIELTHKDLHEGNLNAELCNALTWLYVRPEPTQWVQGMHTEWGMASSVFPAAPYAHLIADFISNHPQYLTWCPEPTISHVPESLTQPKAGTDAAKKACCTDGKPTVTYNGVLQRNFVFQSIMNPNHWKHLGVDLNKVERASYRHTDLSPARWSNLALALENLPLIEELKPLSPEVEALITGAVGVEVGEKFRDFISGHRRLWLPYLNQLQDEELLRAPASALGSNGPEVCARVSFYVSQMCDLWATGPTRWDEDFEESRVSADEFLELAVRLVSLVILGGMEHGKYYNPDFVRGVLPVVEEVRKVVFETSAHLAASDVPPGLVPPGLIDALNEVLGSGEDICDAGGLKLYSLFEYMDALVNAGD